MKPDTLTMPTTFTTPPQTLLDAFAESFPDRAPDVITRAPGRINLLGGHVDIQDGLVINIAIDRGIWVAAAHSPNGHLRLRAIDLNESVTVRLDDLDSRTDIEGRDLPRWARYPAGVAWALAQRGVTVGGIDAAFLGSVTMRAGLSSSAAVEMAFAVAWQALGGWTLSCSELAQAGREAERSYMGLGTGIQDQFTVLCAERDRGFYLDCRSLETETLPLPADARVVVCDTLTRRELVGSSYNSRSADCKAAVSIIAAEEPSVHMLRDVPLDLLQAFEPRLTADQFRRSRHVVTEIARVAEGRERLLAGDLAAFGALMNRSYFSARNDYGSSSPALDAMWFAATGHPACYGARYSGGGEAGAIVALVEADAVDSFIKHASENYLAQTGNEGNFFTVRPVEGAGVTSEGL